MDIQRLSRRIVGVYGTPYATNWQIVENIVVYAEGHLTVPWLGVELAKFKCAVKKNTIA
ncbi:MAG TPA: hypothetical protein VJJ76_00635 [archaeon]|nr:hypothetical protein [archaeon]